MRDRLAEYAEELGELERELTGEMLALEKQLAFVDAELALMETSKEEIMRSWFLKVRLERDCRIITLLHKVVLTDWETLGISINGINLL